MKNDKKQNFIRNSVIALVISLIVTVVVNIIMIVLCFFITGDFFTRLWNALDYLCISAVLCSGIFMICGCAMSE